MLQSRVQPQNLPLQTSKEEAPIVKTSTQLWCLLLLYYAYFLMVPIMR